MEKICKPERKKRKTKDLPFCGKSFVLALVAALPSGFRLLLALYAGLFIMFALTNFCQDARAGALTLETLERAFQRFVLVDMNLRHLFSLPSLISPETTPSARCSPFDRRMATVRVLYRVQPGESTAFFRSIYLFTFSFFLPEENRPITPFDRPSSVRPEYGSADAARSGRRRARNWTPRGSRSSGPPGRRFCRWPA